MLTRYILGAALPAVAALMFSFVQNEAPSKPQDDAADFKITFEPQYASEAVTKLDSLLTELKNQQEERKDVVENVMLLSQAVANFEQRLSEKTLTRDDVVKLVSTTFDEKQAEETASEAAAGEVKADFGACNCDCDEKIAELTKQIDELKGRVTALESQSIKPGLSAAEVTAKLSAMGYRSASYGSTTTTTTTKVTSGGSTGSLNASGGSTGSLKQTTAASPSNLKVTVFTSPGCEACKDWLDGPRDPLTGVRSGNGWRQHLESRGWEVKEQEAQPNTGFTPYWTVCVNDKCVQVTNEEWLDNARLWRIYNEATGQGGGLLGNGPVGRLLSPKR